ncbi:Maf family protein [Tanticharoenia sakaeratensis]|uniref:Nucleoside triphosphate pyrophosphatase n=1 Tax=Tanticharoenia sakaeratensis NBRC 103193 TaxID=1231623 RepID=A0A0D6MPQ3_9PROT|nr:Maf family protein [Tanticharoenia sakaeratensis]GAN55360.1 septum formation inhibitor nucleotide-binding protein Maf [Tanticharoenia sakaeratensis NBRC 103193]GBQ16601.1 septum formation inhibitor nucleotide-binding protein Maf [Tanticharoenia sakaeratensis NBRC 103193]
MTRVPPPDAADRPHTAITAETDLILASGSTIRQTLLRNAGLTIAIHPAPVDEDAIKRAHGTPDVTADHTDRLALTLAHAKAAAIAARHPDALTIGCDQILRCGQTLFDKPRSRAEARTHLDMLRGHAHQLHTAIVLHHGPDILWQHVERPTLHMRDVSAAFLDAYCEMEGETMLTTVGAYRLEGPGIQLFERIDGDHTAILGLPLLPLLGILRTIGKLPR